MRRFPLEQVFELALEHVSPPQVQQFHARFARQVLSDHLGRVTGRPHVKKLIDGREGLDEEQVRPYGVIRYEFSRLSEIATFALQRCRELSPVESGEYRNAWFLMAEGQRISEQTIPEGVPLTITNDQPYHRVLEMTVNAQRFFGQKRTVKLPPGIVERVRQDIFSQYGRTLQADIRYLLLEGGYVLKGRQRSAAMQWTQHRKEGRKTVDLGAISSLQNDHSAPHRRGESTFSAIRSDAVAGQPMTYPALVLSPL